ncbi:hypothetical protein FB446DRAFT_295034 [Lentinula raphanica]|uniref:Uncharacterized protein n=1 Tax=Lentinula raphanica TaxID=153919 RepID=A0AA38NY31_9AGAR|nr:hypothetical protein C8R42DRAFT_724882 [Lentinula raphanica]KAJ3764461.1 hypothetical protein EV360DRAFT_77406 [Lentinula raphanica]KAJ3768101.1 hypothetical protein FB446DRAFT_295034 [Lentinula raphanica]KAJ3820774.1 hypothetical protein F5880DRAFT_911387 [Lentinula raphanica]KAJ3832773.1 hypothetical protein F5878DRAFT_591326 [Lentinula raphanica]
MSLADDLPWPELGNVSRGATRGNQGQKGVLGPPDRDGRCTLQLRVQPGVLAVRLNRQASDWYRTLDNEVNRALKLTKTYWRKARRRQDYDSRADQDHMELHEWLQQLKDKTMSHLELLMQKGDIQGPPYTMPDDIELTFLRKFIERQAAGIPHNPRLRNGADPGYIIRDHSVDSGSPDPPENYLDQRNRGVDTAETGNNHMSLSTSRPSDSPTLRNPESLTQEATTSKQALQMSRAALARAQKDTQDAFLRYTACLDAERQARQSVAAAEKRRDDVMAALLSMNTAEQRSRQSSVSLEEAQAAHALTRYHNEAQDFKNRSNTKLEWGDAEAQGIYATEPMAHLENHGRIVRKHSRTWENGGQLPDPQYGEVLGPGQLRSPSLNSDFQDLSGLPPRKRMHHMIPGYDVMSNPLQAQNMTLQP